MPGRGKHMSSTAKTIIFNVFFIHQAAEPKKKSQRIAEVDEHDSEGYWLL